MTLHLNHITPAFVVQASDRLVTLAGGAPHDRRANKNVVYSARDALVSCGYTGEAYVGELTTDEWISFALLGEAPDRDALRAVRLGGPSQIPLDIGWSMSLLVRALTDAARSGALRNPSQMQVACVGWQWRRRGQRIRPIAIWVGYDAGASCFRARQLFPRNTFDEAQSLAVPSGHLTTGEERDLGLALRAATSSDESRLALADAIRRNAGTNARVGADAMTVILEPARFPHVPIAWLNPGMPSTVQLDVGESVPEYYSPLLVRAGMRCPPMLIAGQHSLHFGPFLVDYEPPSRAGSRVAMAWQIQSRVPRPR